MELREALGTGARTAFCTITSAPGFAARYFSDIVEEVPVVGGPLSMPAGFYSNAQSLICGTEPTPAVLDPGTTPITGCNAVPYRTRTVYTRTVGGVEETVNDLDNNIYTGPVADVIITDRPQGGGQGASFDLDVEFASGTFRIISRPFTDINTTAEIQSVTFERTDGQPDSCGPTPPPPPLEPGDRTINIPIDINGNTVNVDFTLDGPLVSVGGNVFAPVTVLGPNFDFNLKFDLSTGDINFDFGGGAKGPECCPEDDEDDIPTKIVRGVVVTIVSANPNRYFNEIPIGSESPIYGPYVGLLRFYRTSGGERIYSQDYPVKTSPQDIVCPWEPGAEGYVLDNQTDAQLVGRAYFAKLQPQPSEQ